MAYGLIALGSNLGDRAAQLRQATAKLARLPATRLIACSRWHETPPIGGPRGQGLFLNAAALVGSSLAPAALFAELRRIEEQLGRTRGERWTARSLDLDLLLYDQETVQTPELVLPHPRMECRRFVLEPAAEIAAWMVHPESAWTVGGLLNHLDEAAEVVAVAASEAAIADGIVTAIASRLSLPEANAAGSRGAKPAVTSWRVDPSLAQNARPKLLLAVAGSGGTDSRQLRKMLHLPSTGPVAWVTADALQIDESLAAVQSVWPSLAT
jgi:2-amino-4-hydroxy-6-hydroxymethyldihydropteridine diphosphokinase